MNRPLCRAAPILLAIVAVAADAPPVVLEDVASRSGVRFVLDNGASAERHLIETMAGGVAVFDYNNDRRPDIYFVNGAAQPSLVKTDARFFNRLFRNEGGGRFADVTLQAGVKGEGYGVGVAAADYDSDGHRDLFIAGVNRDILYRNRGDGTFEDVTAKAGLTSRAGTGRKPWSVGAGWFDYDEDGFVDLFIVNYVDWDPASERPCQAGAERIYCHPKHYAGLPNSLFRNRGDGSFEDVSAKSGIGGHTGKGMGLAFLDYDGDHRLDIFVANDTVPNFLFRNEGNGRFREVGLTAGVAFNDDGRAISAMGAAAGDVDNDGDEDLFITANANETFPLFRNSGRGHLSDVTYPTGVGRVTMLLTGWSNGVFDFNNDGRKDLFAACGALDANTEKFSSRASRQPNLVLVNLAAGSFQATGNGFSQPGRHRGAAFGDFEGDGRIDAVVTRIGEPAAVFRNGTAGGHWLGLRLRGVRANRDGIGARVQITGASGAVQTSRVTTATGYASSSDVAVHFGLGADTSVRRIEIRWPGGTQQVLTGIAADRYLDVVEPPPAKP